MEKIKISEYFIKGNYKFEGARDKIYENAKVSNIEVAPNSCEVCGYIISYRYSYIIEKLRENNLLSKDFKKICCKCKDKEDLIKRLKEHNLL